jgi:murein L,D-transpeptidase YcbB/YkuD
LARLLASASVALALLGGAACNQAGAPTGSRSSDQASKTAPADTPFSADQVRAVLQTLDSAEDQGFAPGAFGKVGDIRALLQSADAAQEAEGQRRLRAAIIAYARAQHGQGLPSASFPREWGIRPPPYDAALELRTAMSEHHLADWLKSQPPPSPRYAALVQALATYKRIEAEGGWRPLAEAASEGAARSRSNRQALKTRLAVEDPELADAPQKQAAGAEALTNAVMRFQAHHGLQVTGGLDPQTYQALNLPVSARVDQIRANLARWRWLPRALPATRIEVDAASGTLDYYQDGQLAMHMLAAAGKPDDQTPMLISRINQVVLNPAWHVPKDIARKELYPKQRRHPGYFAREGFVRGKSEAAPLIQKPGPKNALGQVKFEFDNPYGVYVHDTPAKSAFNLAQRSVSHGCVRLERAVDLAKALLSSTPGWSAERVDQALSSSDTQTVKLAQPVPVMLLYWTAYVQDGQVFLRPDPYGWDDLLVRLLDASASGQG